MRALAKELTMMISEEQIARRKFFSHAAFFSFFAILSCANARYNDAHRTIGLGFSFYGMKSLSINAALKAIAEIGYDCVELPVMSDWPADSARFDAGARRELRGQLTERELRLTSLMENLPALGDDAQHRGNLDRLKRAAEMARDLGRDKAVPLVETILGGKAGEFEAVRDRLAERVTAYARVMQDAEVTLAVKAHIGNATQRPEQLR